MTFLTDAELDAIYEASKIDQIPVGSEIRQLVGEIRHHRRLDRVDTALARQLGQSIEANARLHEHLAHIRREIEQWAKAYPLPAFPEPDMRKAERFLREGGITLDAVTASNIRHVLKRVLGIIDRPPDESV
jgi:hypothetical protein